MRRPDRFILFAIVALVVAIAPRAHADDPRAEARVHYQAGVKMYSGGDYRGAIKEFTAAQQLAPADLNSYNLALCYDKLGDAEPAVQYYREYLNKVPNTDKRAEIEASVSRLEAALKSAAAKKADEAKKADDAKKAEEAKKADDAKKAEEAKKADEEAKKPEGGVAGAAGVGAGAAGAGGAGAGAAVGAGSTGVPSTGQAFSTGDAQLDRVQGVDINQIRDQRIGGAGSGIPDTRGGPAMGAPNGPRAVGNANGMPPTTTAANGAPPPNGPPPADKPKAETPLYKKWWFWVVIGVSVFVVVEIATSGSSKQTSTVREMPPTNHPYAPATPGGGLTLFHF